MPRYNWEELKKEFMLGGYRSLQEFADKKGLKRNGNFNKKTRGWAEEKAKKEQEKGQKIVEGVIKRQIKQEVDYNTTHLKLWGEFLNILQEALSDKENLLNKQDRISAYVLEKFANVMEKAQKGQRLALGLDEKEQSDDGSLDKLVEALKKSQGDS